MPVQLPDPLVRELGRLAQVLVHKEHNSEQTASVDLTLAPAKVQDSVPLDLVPLELATTLAPAADSVQVSAILVSVRTTAQLGSSGPVQELVDSEMDSAQVLVLVPEQVDLVRVPVRVASETDSALEQELVDSEMDLGRVLVLELVALAATSLGRPVRTMAVNSEPTVAVCNPFLVALTASAI